MVGQVATRRRLEVTALGDQMNEGARIEAAAKDGAIRDAGTIPVTRINRRASLPWRLLRKAGKSAYFVRVGTGRHVSPRTSAAVPPFRRLEASRSTGVPRCIDAPVF